MQENRVPELVHLPVPDECTSIVRHIAKCSSSTSDDIVQHQHPITLHHDYPVYKDDDEIDDHHHHHHHWLPKCNGCVQFISPPFYTCAQCPKLFLHDSCARLPHVGARLPRGGVRPPNVGVLLTRIRHDSLVCMLTGLDSQDKFSHGISTTMCCNRLTNGFTYSSVADNRDIRDAHAMTHDAHAETHVLQQISQRLVLQLHDMPQFQHTRRVRGFPPPSTTRTTRIPWSSSRPHLLTCSRRSATHVSRALTSGSGNTAARIVCRA